MEIYNIYILEEKIYDDRQKRRDGLDEEAYRSV